jgi:hypothetical protein
MSSEHSFEFTKENIDLYLKEIAKEYRIICRWQTKHSGSLPTAIKAGSGFRDSRTAV